MADDRPVALLTGAARGLGAAAALALAKRGWRLVLTDICADIAEIPYALANVADLDACAARCREIGAEVVAMIADVRRQEALDAAAAAAKRKFGRLDAAISIAGVVVGGRVGWETGEEDWRTVMDINAAGAWRLARAAIPHLLAAPAPRRGRFVAVSSAAGVGGLPMLAAYSASKHAVIGLVKSLAAELAPLGITANTICPGSMDTAGLAATARLYGLETAAGFAAYQPIGRLLDPLEVAEIIAMLCDPGTGAMTGAVVAADGGMTAPAAWGGGG
jgi:SDR family mycofactocin-dependent oxidoreductase